MNGELGLFLFDNGF